MRNDGPPLVSPTDQLEKEIGSDAVEGKVAHLVDNEELGLTEGSRTGRDLLGEKVGDLPGGQEVDVLSLGDGGQPQGDGQVGLSHPWWAQEDDVLSVGDDVRVVA